MGSEAAFLKGLVRKGKEGFIGAEEPAFKGRCFRPEESAVTLSPVGSAREKPVVEQRKVGREGWGPRQELTGQGEGHLSLADM